jgi:hypothetical protein
LRVFLQAATKQQLESHVGMGESDLSHRRSVMSSGFREFGLEVAKRMALQEDLAVDRLMAGAVRSPAEAFARLPRTHVIIGVCAAEGRDFRFAAHEGRLSLRLNLSNGTEGP